MLTSLCVIGIDRLFNQIANLSTYYLCVLLHNGEPERINVVTPFKSSGGTPGRTGTIRKVLPVDDTRMTYF
jgi:hypothetical protein